ncbi:MAG TPA: permease prefix domain 1-containing protein [Streptosporangiaceae bacterium]|nr:permease prefix domain 1-containing protein [Streptosporangiaceae bacterium]
MTRQGPPASAAGPAVECYLAEVAGRLPGPDRGRDGIVAELRSGLLDAMDAYQSAGLPTDQAVQAAIREFGDPGRVADGFRAEIAAAQARRVVVTLLVTGPLVGLLWIATAMSSHLGIRFAVPWQRAGLGASLGTGLGTGLLLVAVAVGVTAWAGVIGIASTGRLTRWLTAPPRLAPTAAAVAGFGAVSADSLGLVLLAVQLAAVPGKLSPVPAIAAAAASVTRLLLARRAARQCLALRASLA